MILRAGAVLELEWTSDLLPPVIKINLMYKFFKHLAAAVFYGTTMDSAFINGTFIVERIISMWNDCKSKHLESS